MRCYPRKRWTSTCTDTVKLSFVLFDEIEKASDALWNLLLGILDKATLTLGDNRRVDFSRSMIFLTSNLGASEMDADSAAARWVSACTMPVTAAAQAGKLDNAGTEAARRRFSPEFMNRIDRTVVFNPLGRTELQRILTLELEAVERRILLATGAASLSIARWTTLLASSCSPKARTPATARAISSGPSSVCWYSRSPI